MDEKKTAESPTRLRVSNQEGDICSTEKNGKALYLVNYFQEFVLVAGRYWGFQVAG